jgi:hypothetical protein
MGKGRERQIILKTDRRDILLEMGLGGKFQTRSSGWDENRIFSKAMFAKLKYAMARWVLTRVPAGPRPAPLRPSTIFQPRSDGVTGYVTSSHGAATPLRYGVTGNLAGNQQVRSRQVIVDRPIVPAASRVLVCRLWIARPGDLRELVLRDRHRAGR